MSSVVSAFRGSVPDEAEHRFVLAGLDAGKRYRLHFQDGSAPDREATGSELMGAGLLARPGSALSSELVLLSEEGAGRYIRTDVLVDTDRPEIKTADWEMGGP
jgi:hypothetical protein